MPSWTQILDELNDVGSTFDLLRRRYLETLSQNTGRNVIAYYSGWLQKTGVDNLNVNDADKNGLMTVIHKLDRTKGLDLLLHTPGGDIAATESIVNYLRAMFGEDIRVIVPQLALSAGTMIACSAKSIVMGKQSSLGPIDPQYGGIPAHGVIEEFNRAYDEIKQDNLKIHLWQPIISKYPITFIGECEKALKWSRDLVQNWLETCMFQDQEDQDVKRATIDNILTELGDHSISLSHSRHISAAKAQEIGLKIELLEDDDAFQDAVLSVHHSMIHTISASRITKIIENHKGAAFIQSHVEQ